MRSMTIYSSGHYGAIYKCFIIVIIFLAYQYKATGMKIER